MLKYMKYELKGSYKFVAGILSLLLIAFTVIQYTSYRRIERVSSGPVPYDTTAQIAEFAMAISSLVLFGAIVTAFIYIIGLFRKELYEERGYLTFTLPLTGNQVLGAKLIVAIIWFVLLGLLTGLYNLVLANILYLDENIIEQMKMIFSQLSISEIVLPIIMLSVFGIVTLIVVYFSIALSRVSIKRKKLGGLWFIVFLLINGLIGYASTLVSRLIPYGISVKDFTIANQDELYNSMYDASLSMSQSSGQIVVQDSVNIASFIFFIIIGIVAFLATSHMLERKIDL